MGKVQLCIFMALALLSLGHCSYGNKAKTQQLDKPYINNILHKLISSLEYASRGLKAKEESNIDNVGINLRDQEEDKEENAYIELFDDSEQVQTRGLLPEEISQFVQYHNDKRKTVDPMAANMKKMVWEPELHTVSQNWANQCLLKHNSNRATETFSSVGENIFLTTAANLNIGAVVNAWDKEKAYFNYNNITCEKGKMCGHYTQVVWAKSNLLGCGYKKCPLAIGYLRNYTDAYLVVCNYSPAGNYRGVRPYIKGSPCDSCYDKCEDNLCNDF